MTSPDLISFETNSDLLGVNEIINNSISKHKSYYELEQELIETKQDIKNLQEYIEKLKKRIEELEEKCEENKYVSYTLNGKLEMIDTYADSILFEYNHHGNPKAEFTIKIDKTVLRNFDFTNTNILLKPFRHIKTINLVFRFPIHDCTTVYPTEYFTNIFNLIINLSNINKNVIININTSIITFPFHWLKDIFKGVKLENISSFNLEFWERKDVQNERMINDKLLDNLNKKIMNKIKLKAHNIGPNPVFHF